MKLRTQRQSEIRDDYDATPMTYKEATEKLHAAEAEVAKHEAAAKVARFFFFQARCRMRDMDWEAARNREAA